MKTLFVLFSSVWLTVTAAATGASDAFWASLPGIITSVFSGIGVLLGLYLTHRVLRMNKKVEKVDEKVSAVAVEVDGKLEKMMELTRDKFHAEGVKEATDAAAKEKAASDAGELKQIKEQQMKDQPPIEK